MIKIKRILLESPDGVEYTDTVTGKSESLYYFDGEAYPFYYIDGEYIEYEHMSGTTHKNLILAYMTKFAEIYKDDYKIKMYTDIDKDGDFVIIDTVRIYPHIVKRLKFEISGRIWRNISKVNGISGANIISFWLYPATKSHLLKFLKAAKLNPNKTFVDIETSTLVPANEYDAVDDLFAITKRMSHKMPPHMR